MTTKSKFGITEDGNVFLLNGGFRKLGHITHLTTARTPIAQEVQQWWRAQLESDRPTENLIDVQEKGSGRRQYRLRHASETGAASYRGFE
jgi:hypothetical protein